VFGEAVVDEFEPSVGLDEASGGNLFARARQAERKGRRTSVGLRLRRVNRPMTPVQADSRTQRRKGKTQRHKEDREGTRRYYFCAFACGCRSL
jgi:hypothetical protein